MKWHATRQAIVFATLLLSANDALSAKRPPGGTPKAPRADLDIVGVVVGPAKADGRAWDGQGAISASDVSELVSLATPGNPAGPAIAQAVALASVGTSLPDVFGYAEVYTTKGRQPWRLSLASPQQRVQDSLTPNFRAAVSGIPLGPGLRVRITLYDADLQEHDPIGVVEITADDLTRALQRKRITEISVADQSNGQVLYIKVAVRPTTNSDIIPLTPIF
jgi:hypothetical protein